MRDLTKEELSSVYGGICSSNGMGKPNKPGKWCPPKHPKGCPPKKHGGKGKKDHGWG